MGKDFFYFLTTTNSSIFKHNWDSYQVPNRTQIKVCWQQQTIDSTLCKIYVLINLAVGLASLSAAANYSRVFPRDGRRAGFCDPARKPGFRAGFQVENFKVRVPGRAWFWLRVPDTRTKTRNFWILFYFRVKNVLNSFGVLNPYRR